MDRFRKAAKRRSAKGNDDELLKTSSSERVTPSPRPTYADTHWGAHPREVSSEQPLTLGTNARGTETKESELLQNITMASGELEVQDPSTDSHEVTRDLNLKVASLEKQLAEARLWANQMKPSLVAIRDEHEECSNTLKSRERLIKVMDEQLQVRQQSIDLKTQEVTSTRKYLEATQKEYENKILKVRQESDTAAQAHEALVKQLKTDLSRSLQELEASENDRQNETRAWQQDIQYWKTRIAEKEEQLQRNHDIQIDNLKTVHKQEVHELIEEHKGVINQMEKDNKIKIEKLTQALLHQRTEYHEKLHVVDAEFHCRSKDLEAQIVKAQTSHQNAEAEKEKTIEALKQEVQAGLENVQKQNKHIEEVHSRFTMMAREKEAISRENHSGRRERERLSDAFEHTQRQLKQMKSAMEKMAATLKTRDDAFNAFLSSYDNAKKEGETKDVKE